MSKSEEIRGALVNTCHLIYDKDMVCGSGGNISARIDDTIFITPSGYSLGDIKPQDIVEVTTDGSTSSVIKPSKELFLHMKAYEVRPGINVVIHVHSLYATIVGIMTEDEKLDNPMQPYTPGYAMRVRNINGVPFFVPGSKELADSIGECLKVSDVVLMKNHGMVIVGESFEEAFSVAEEVEQNAKMHVLLGGRGHLSKSQVAAIIDMYK